MAFEYVAVDETVTYSNSIWILRNSCYLLANMKVDASKLCIVVTCLLFDADFVTLVLHAATSQLVAQLPESRLRRRQSTDCA